MDIDEVRAELIRSRGFIRGAETQLTKSLAALDALDVPADPTPEPPDDSLTLVSRQEWNPTDPGDGWSYTTDRSDGRIDREIVESDRFAHAMRVTWREGMTRDGHGALAAVFNTETLGRLRRIYVRWWERRSPNYVYHRWSGTNKSWTAFVRSDAVPWGWTNVYSIMRGPGLLLRAIEQAPAGSSPWADMWVPDSSDPYPVEYDLRAGWVQFGTLIDLDAGRLSIDVNEQVVFDETRGDFAQAEHFGELKFDPIDGGRTPEGEVIVHEHDQWMEFGPVEVYR